MSEAVASPIETFFFGKTRERPTWGPLTTLEFHVPTLLRERKFKAADLTPEDLVFQVKRKMTEGARDKAYALGFTYSFRDIFLGNLRFEGEWARAECWIPEAP